MIERRDFVPADSSCVDVDQSILRIVRKQTLGGEMYQQTAVFATLRILYVVTVM